MLLQISILKKNTKKPLWIWDTLYKESQTKKLILPWVTEVWEDWLHVSLIHWPLLTIQHGDTVSDINTVFSGKLLKMDHKSKSPIIGLNMVTHGKSKESTFNIKFILEVK